MPKIVDIDFSSLDPKAMGTWPLLLRIAVAVAAGVSTVIAVYILFLSSKIDALDKQYKDEETKRKEFKDKYNMAINLSEYEMQMDEVTQMYVDQLKQMPPVGNIPGLLNLVTNLARKNNLAIESIKLGEPNERAGFYNQMDLDLAMIGRYHNIGRFLADLSKLPRIVTMHGFVLKPKAGKNEESNGDLYLTLTLRAYWQAPNTTSTNDGDSKEDKSPGKVPKGAPGQTGAAAPRGQLGTDMVEVEQLPEGARIRPGAPAAMEGQ